MKNPERTVDNITDKLKTAFIGSVDEQGYSNVKAMLQPRRREGTGVFYFTTNTSSIRVRQFLSDDKACVYFYDSHFSRGTMLRDAMEVLTDAESKEMVWRGGDTEYYLQGVTDPNYCVLKFTAISGRFYNDYHSKELTVE